MDPQVIQIFIQGGAVGVLILFGMGIYKLSSRAMDYVNILMTNHLNHIQSEIGKVGGSLDKLSDAILLSLDRFTEHRARLETGMKHIENTLENNARVAEYFKGKILDSESWRQQGRPKSDA